LPGEDLAIHVEALARLGNNAVGNLTSAIVYDIP